MDSERLEFKLVLAESGGAAHQEAGGQRDYDGGDKLPNLWNGNCDGLGFTRNKLWLEALGLTVAGAIPNYKLSLRDAGGHSLELGLNLVVCTYNGPAVLSAVNRVLEPLRANGLNDSGTVANIEREHALESLDRAVQAYRRYRQTEILPNRQYLEVLARKIASLESKEKAPCLLENPLAGQLALRLQRFPAASLLAIYDDFCFADLLQHSRSSRAMLDIDLVTRSWHQQTFSAAYLEKGQDGPVFSPQVWVIIVARPETVAEFLLSEDPLLAGLASCCWFVDATESTADLYRLSHWTAVVAKLASRRSLASGGRIEMSKDSAAQFFTIHDRVDEALREEPRWSAGALAQLPRQIYKISAIHHLAQTDTPSAITRRQIECAGALADISARDRHAFVQSWRAKLALKAFEELCQLVVTKVVGLGPLTTRELQQCLDSMPLKILLPALTHLVSTDQLVKSGKTFDIPQRWLSKLRVEIC